jgi:hypothetical protein
LKIDQTVIATPSPTKPGERNSADVTTPKAGPHDHMPLPEIAQPNLVQRPDVPVSFHRKGVGGRVRKGKGESGWGCSSNSDFADNLPRVDPLHFFGFNCRNVSEAKKGDPRKEKGT